MLTHRERTILGDIPSDWDRELLSNLVVETKGGDWGGDEGDESIRVLRSTNFTNRGELDFDGVAVRFFSKQKAQSFAVKRNDILLERSGGGPTQPVGRVGFINEDLAGYWFSNFVQLLRPDETEIDPEYLGWLLFELNRSGVVERLQHQTTQMRNLDFRDYLRVYIPRPLIHEQKIIARILRVANEAMGSARDKLDAARRLKTALMQQLFTRGLPGRHARFISTKLGKIPKSWEVSRISDLISENIYNGVSPQSRPDPPGIPILNVGCIHDGRVDFRKVTYVDLPEASTVDLLVSERDFFVLRGNGNRAFIATGGLVSETPPSGCVFSDLLIKIVFDPTKVAEGFMPLLWQSQTFLRRLQAKAVSGSGLWKIGLREIRRHEFAKPPRAEQEDMISLVQASDRNILACEAELESFQRLKSSLLQHLLTGRVRVRT